MEGVRARATEPASPSTAAGESRDALSRQEQDLPTAEELGLRIPPNTPVTLAANGAPIMLCGTINEDEDGNQTERRQEEHSGAPQRMTTGISDGGAQIPRAAATDTTCREGGQTRAEDGDGGRTETGAEETSGAP